MGSAISRDSIAGKKTAGFVEGIFISDRKTDMVYRANHVCCVHPSIRMHHCDYLPDGGSAGTALVRGLCHGRKGNVLSLNCARKDAPRVREGWGVRAHTAKMDVVPAATTQCARRRCPSRRNRNLQAGQAENEKAFSSRFLRFVTCFLLFSRDCLCQSTKKDITLHL